VFGLILFKNQRKKKKKKKKKKKRRKKQRSQMNYSKKQDLLFSLQSLKMKVFFMEYEVFDREPLGMLACR